MTPETAPPHRRKQLTPHHGQRRNATWVDGQRYGLYTFAPPKLLRKRGRQAGGLSKQTFADQGAPESKTQALRPTQNIQPLPSNAFLSGAREALLPIFPDAATSLEFYLHDLGITSWPPPAQTLYYLLDALGGDTRLALKKKKSSPRPIAKRKKAPRPSGPSLIRL